MKRIFIVLAVVLFFLQLPASAQKARVGIETGVSSSNLYGTINDASTDYKSRAGFTIGMLVDAPIAKSRFSFRPELSYFQKGAVTSETVTQKDYYALRYAEFAFNFVYSTKGVKDVSIFFGLGPSVSLNLPSKSITKTKSSKVETSIILDNEGAAVLRGIDFGATGLTGLAYKNKYFFSFNYNLGIETWFRIRRRQSAHPMNQEVVRLLSNWEFYLIINETRSLFDTAEQ